MIKNFNIFNIELININIEIIIIKNIIVLNIYNLIKIIIMNTIFKYYFRLNI